MKPMNYCTGYCGLACVDGSCPRIENRVYSCSECWLFRGCEDCISADECDLPQRKAEEVREAKEDASL